MKRLIFAILFLTQAVALAKPDFDSLKSIYYKAETDTAKVNILIDLIRFYNQTNTDSAKHFKDLLDNVSIKTNNPKGKVASMMLSGIKISIDGNFEKSNEELFKVAEIAKGKNLPEILTETYLTIAINYSRMSDYDKTTEYAKKSLELAEKHNYKRFIIRNYILLGILNFHLENYLNAISYYKQGMRLAEEINNLDLLSTLYANITTAYFKIKEMEKALEYSDKTIALYEVRKDKRSLGIAYHNRAAIYYDMEDYKEAHEWLTKSLEIKLDMNDKIGVAITYLAMSENYIKLEKHNDALATALKTVDTFKESNAKANLMKAYDLISQSYRNLKFHERAYEYLLKFNEIKDTLYKESKESAISEVNAKFELSEREKENEAYKHQTQRQFLIILIVLLALTIVALISILLYLKNRSMTKMNQLLNENKARIEEQNIELDSLNKELNNTIEELHEINSIKDKFFSIIAHDLRSPLSSYLQLMDMLIRDYTVYSDEERMEILLVLQESSNSTFALLEKLLLWAKLQRNQVILQSEPIDLNFLAMNIIEELKPNWKLKQLKIENKVSAGYFVNSDYDMISFVIRNLLSNAIKFTPNKNSISIFAIEKEDLTIVTVQDTGRGMPKDKINNLFRIDKAESTMGTNNERGNGLGLILVNDFIGKQGGEIWVESREGEGSSFSFSIPKRNGNSGSDISPIEE